MPNHESRTKCFVDMDTCNASILHLLARQPGQKRLNVWWLVGVYVLIVVLTLGGMIEGLLLSEPSVLWGDDVDGLNLPFVKDWNTHWQFAVTFPVLMFMLLSERRLVGERLRELLDGGILKPRRPLESYCHFWRRSFRIWNILAQLIALGVAWFVWGHMRALLIRPSWGSWQALGGDVNLAGYVWLWWQSACWFIATLYFLRALLIWRFLSSVAGTFSITLMPFHSDRCGGLKPVGFLGLRNQYVLAVIGLNLVFMVLVSHHFKDDSLVPYIAASVAFYVLGGPLAFLGPLLPFRRAMVTEKTKLVEEVGRAVEAKYSFCLQQLRANQLSEDDMKNAEQLATVLERVKSVPVWPFDVDTVRRFASAYVIPLVSMVLSPFVKAITEYLKGVLP